MVESCSQIAGACLEQSSWLRRNVSVREDELSAANSITEKDIEKGNKKLIICHSYIFFFLTTLFIEFLKFIIKYNHF